MPSSNKTIEGSDKKLIKEIDGLFEESKTYRKTFEEDWLDYEKFYDGKHWERTTIDNRRPVNNWVFSIIESETPVLTDSRPGTDVVAIEEENFQKARVMKEAIDYVYHINNVDLKLSQGVRSALKTGNGYLYVDFDPDAEEGIGQITIKNLPWRHVYLDPAASHIDEMSYCIIKQPMRIDDLERLYPKTKGKIKSEDIDVVSVGDDSIIRDEHRFHLTTSDENTFRPDDMAYLWEIWKKDYTMQSIPKEETEEMAEEEYQQLTQGIVPDVTKYIDHAEIIEILDMSRTRFLSEFLGVDQSEITLPISDEITNVPEISNFLVMLDDLIQTHRVMLESNPDGKRPKYDNQLRLILRINNMIVYDDSNPVGDGMYPIAPIYAYKEEERIYGFGEVKNIISPQRAYDDLHWAEYKSLRLNTNTGWVKDDQSQVDANSLTNEEGLVITKKQGTEVRRLDPGTVSPQLNAKQVELIQNIEQISGINEATQGRRPVGVTSGRAIEALQQQSIGRIRLKSRMLEEFTMLRLGKLTASRIVKYWNTERILKVFDDNQQVTTEVFNPDEMSDLKYEVRMSPGTTFGLSKEVILEQSQNLLAQGIIDAETFVILNDLPFKSTILNKIRERDEMRMQLEALAGENEQLKAQLGASAGQIEGQPSETTPQGDLAAAQPVQGVVQ